MTWENLNECILVRVPTKRNANWSQSFLLTSDIHLDSRKCQTSMLKKHLEQLEEKDAYLIDNGDLFDCMGGKYDKRSNKSDLLPRLQVANYFDELVDYASEVFKPHAKRIINLADGNHELSIRDRHEIDLTGRLQRELNQVSGATVLRQKYVGWFRFMFEGGQGQSESITMYRTHGNGGNAPATKGVTQTARRQDMIDADLYLSGHIHTNFQLPRPMLQLSSQGVVRIVEKMHHQIGTYKDSTWCTWENMKGFAPPSLGGSWLTFKYNSRTKRIYYEITRAV